MRWSPRSVCVCVWACAFVRSLDLPNAAIFICTALAHKPARSTRSPLYPLAPSSPTRLLAHWLAYSLAHSLAQPSSSAHSLARPLTFRCHRTPDRPHRTPTLAASSSSCTVGARWGYGMYPPRSCSSTRKQTRPTPTGTGHGHGARARRHHTRHGTKHGNGHGRTTRLVHSDSMGEKVR